MFAVLIVIIYCFAPNDEMKAKQLFPYKISISGGQMFIYDKYGWHYYKILVVYTFLNSYNSTERYEGFQ